MRRTIRVSVLTVLCALLVCMSVIGAFAATPAVNGQSAAVGDAVEYTFYLGNANKSVVGIQMVFTFDPEALEFKDVTYANMKPVSNTDKAQTEGMIYMNNSDLEGIDCSARTEIAKLSFTVKSEAQSDIGYYIQYLYDYDMANITGYTCTYDLSIAGNAVVQTQPQEFVIPEGLGDYGEVATYSNGSVVVGPTDASGEVIRQTETDSNGAVVTQAAGNSGSGLNVFGWQVDTGAFIGIIAAIVVAGGIVVLVIVKTVTKPKSGEDSDK